MKYRIIWYYKLQCWNKNVSYSMGLIWYILRKRNFCHKELTDKFSYLAAVAANVLSIDSLLAESLAIRSRFSPGTDTRAVNTNKQKSQHRKRMYFGNQKKKQTKYTLTIL